MEQMNKNKNMQKKNKHYGLNNNTGQETKLII